VVPYAGGLETEQTLRARLLAERGRLTVVDETALSPAALAAAVDAALDAGRPDAAGIDTGGAAATARILAALAASRAGHAA
jgi:predicted glycosyltransferase